MEAVSSWLGIWTRVLRGSNRVYIQRRRQDLSLKGAKYGYSLLGGANKAIFSKIYYQN
jgi:hypothetical protein